MINAGIVGASGYTGETLLGILLKHPFVRLSYLSRGQDKEQKISELFPKFEKISGLSCGPTDIKQIKEKCDVVFLAMPHTASMSLVPKLISCGKKVIDLSADYRITDYRLYEKSYQVKHTDKANLKQAVYGLPELYRNKIKTASLIANPGCYPTAAVLALAPLLGLGVIEKDNIIIDAKSGISGAGKKMSEGFLFNEANEDFKAYKVNSHQHAPEINQILSRLTGRKTEIIFVPHLLPLYRGILETIYVKRSEVRGRKSKGNIIELYKKFYKDEPFVRIKKDAEFPRLKDVQGTNFCDIGIKDCGSNIIIISAIDNLIKGASGQAVQNMNIMYNFPQETALL
ncbi:MAG: N-acetyl-gamma-glutamyl-phosphate reductase [Candidatus Omnitrophica bacterium]|jgi:N-acetyl-gamma-glutamyl-phosphate reductase|nr:N-acetyl-gamma-glutamyl-phosphate reductase [Candidatus Omnitrophota bacterium]